MGWKQEQFIEKIVKQTYLICNSKGRFSRKRVFFGGHYFRENGARKVLRGSVLNNNEFLTTLRIPKNHLEGYSIL